MARWKAAFSRVEPGDVFLTAVFLLVAVGTVMVYSASAFYGSIEGDAEFFLRRQAAWVPIAFLGCALFRQIDYRFFQRSHWHLLVASTGLLALVLVPGVGLSVNMSRRWLPLGAGLQFQPSELAKLAVILFVSGFLAARPERARQFFKGFLLAAICVLPVFVLTLLEPDFGTSMFILAIAFGLLLLGGVRKRYLLGSALVFLPVIAAFVYWRWDKIQPRLLGVLDPEKVYQVKHSLTALGSGGWLGVGLGASGQKLRFLPEPHTDFIFAILGEELGFAGTAAVILVFIALLWSGAGVVWRARDLFGFLVGAGVVLSLSLQAAINLAVVTASAPTKGIPLPFITHGGSGLCMTLAQVGLLLSIDRVSRQERPLGRLARESPGESAAPGDLQPAPLAP